MSPAAWGDICKIEPQHPQKKKNKKQKEAPNEEGGGENSALLQEGRYTRVLLAHLKSVEKQHSCPARRIAFEKKEVG